MLIYIIYISNIMNIIETSVSMETPVYLFIRINIRRQRLIQKNNLGGCEIICKYIFSISLRLRGLGATSYNFITRKYPVKTKNIPKAGAKSSQIINTKPGQMSFF